MNIRTPITALLCVLLINVHGQLHDTGNNVEIGTTTPTSKLHISIKDRSNAFNLINTLSSTGIYPGFRLDNYDSSRFTDYRGEIGL